VGSLSGVGVSTSPLSVGSPLPTTLPWDSPVPTIPSFLPEIPLFSPSCGGPLLAEFEVASHPLGAQSPEPDFLGSIFYPDAGSRLLTESVIGGSPAGFIASYLPPTNLNGWDSIGDGGSGDLDPLGLAEGLDPHTINRRRKRNKCIGVISDSSNLILGEDLSMAEVVEMADKSVVGKVYG
jgi:hypothetical protein